MAHAHPYTYNTHQTNALKKLKMAKSSVSKAWQPLEHVHTAAGSTLGKLAEASKQFPGDGATQLSELTQEKWKHSRIRRLVYGVHSAIPAKRWKDIHNPPVQSRYVKCGLWRERNATLSCDKKQHSNGRWNGNSLRQVKGGRDKGHALKDVTYMNVQKRKL